MTPPKLPANGFAQKLIFGAVAVLVAYLGWLGIAINGIGREVSAMKSNVDRLVIARDTEQSQRSTSNSDRLDQIQGNAR